MKHQIFNLFASTAKGMEFLLAQEIKTLGAFDIEEVVAGVNFRGSLETAYRVCLWSRIASRVLLVLQQLPVLDAEELYEATQKIQWSDHFNVKQTFAVNFSSKVFANNRDLHHSHFAALKVKDAIVDQFRTLFGQRPSIDPIKPHLRINVYYDGKAATFSIDLSGESLHKRGYRGENVKAPLKENLAAAILLLCEWPRATPHDFIDPMCGSGTLPIEAALMACNFAPGLLRPSFGFLHWSHHAQRLWEDIQDDAREKIIRDKKFLPIISGYDRDNEAIRIAISNLKRAQLETKVNFFQQDLKDIKPTSAQGILVVNPPYGERLGDAQALAPLYRDLGDIMKNRFKGWEGYIFTSNPNLAKSVGLRTSRRHILYNGSIECRLLKYLLF